MNIFESVILGIIQGITEFLPISSSGHLLIARDFFDINQLDLFLEIFLHAGTLVAILLYWRNEILIEIRKIFKQDYDYFLKIIIATIPAGMIGFLFKSEIESVFFNIESSHYLIINYLIMTVVLFSIKNISNNNTDNNFTLKIALLIGIAQIFAILPGISRSGITICIGCLSGLSLKRSTQFSFFIAIPIMFFASVYSIFLNSAMLTENALAFPLICGFITSALIGYLTISILVKIIYSQKFWFFSIYCFCISLFLLVYNYVI